MKKTKQSEDPMRGIFRRGEIYYFQPPMKNRVRPAMVSLETGEVGEAVKRAAEMRASPVLTPAGGLDAELKLHLADRRLNYTRSTADSKAYVLKCFFETLPPRMELERVTTAHIQAYYDKSMSTRNATTAHKRLMTIRAFFNWAALQRKLRRNPAATVQHEKCPHVSRILYCDQTLQDRLIAECPREDLKAVLMLGFHCAMRKNEIIEAVPWWFDLERGVVDMRDTPTLRFTKHKRARWLPMRRELRAWLTEYGLRDPFMVRPDVKRGKSLYRWDFKLPFGEYMKAQNVPWVTPHVMRHTFASLLLINNISIFKVAQWMGDTVDVVEKTYGHLAPRDSDVDSYRRKAPKAS